MEKGSYVYLVVNNSVSRCKITALGALNTRLKAGSITITAPPMHKGLFYSYGYFVDNTRYLLINKLWHFYFAVITEKIRLAIPYKIATKIKL